MFTRTCRHVSVLLFGLAVAALSGCQRSPDTKGATAAAPSAGGATTTIVAAGSSFADPLFEAWRKRYLEQHSDLDIQYDPIGSGEGIQRFLAGETDIGTTDAPVTAEQAATVDWDFVQIPITAGMIALVYHLPEVGGPMRLPRDLYPDIFLGKIARWDDPRIAAANPDLDLPAKLIQVVARQDSSGTTFAFTNHLSAIHDGWAEHPGVAKVIDWPGGTMTVRGNEGVAQRIRITKGSIGYVGAGFAERLSLPMASLENKAGQFAAPDIASGQAALKQVGQDVLPEDLAIQVVDPEGERAYPIVTHTWALVRTDNPDREKAAEIEKLLEWALTDGQQGVETLGYLPLPPEVADAALDALQNTDR